MSATKQKWLDFGEIKAAADFRDVLAHYGINAPSGDDVKVLCPFHDDHKPSLSVNMKKRVFQCFSCKEKGNILDFVRLIEGGTLRNAAECLQSISGGETDHSPAKTKRAAQKGRKMAQNVTQETDAPNLDAAKDEVASDAPNKTLDFELKLKRDHPYLHARGIDEATAMLLDVGYAERGMMKGRICFPIRSAEGELKGYSGRWASDDLPEGTSRYLLPKGFNKAKELFGIEHVPGDVKTLVVVEGFWLTMKLQSQGFPAVGIMGSALSREQASLIKRQFLDLELVMLWFDGDDAGKLGEQAAFMSLGGHVPCLNMRSVMPLNFVDGKVSDEPYDMGVSFDPSEREFEVLSHLSSWIDPMLVKAERLRSVS